MYDCELQRERNVNVIFVFCIVTQYFFFPRNAFIIWSITLFTSTLYIYVVHTLVVVVIRGKERGEPFTILIYGVYQDDDESAILSHACLWGNLSSTSSSSLENVFFVWTKKKTLLVLRGLGCVLVVVVGDYLCVCNNEPLYLGYSLHISPQ